MAATPMNTQSTTQELRRSAARSQASAPRPPIIANSTGNSPLDGAADPVTSIKSSAPGMEASTSMLGTELGSRVATYVLATRTKIPVTRRMAVSRWLVDGSILLGVCWRLVRLLCFPLVTLSTSPVGRRTWWIWARVRSQTHPQSRRIGVAVDGLDAIGSPPRLCAHVPCRGHPWACL